MAEVYASVDLGGTKIACAFATGDGHIVGEKTIPTQSHEGPESVLARIADLVRELAAQTGCQPAAFGMGVPGLADLKNAVTKFLPNLPTQWRDVPVRDILSPRIECPIYLLNDVRAATLGELTFGHGRTAGTMAFFALGTGIGGGVVIDGKLRLGPLGAAGELGHQTILPDGLRCGCGNRGCLETLTSGPAITARGVWLLHCGRAPKLHELVGGNPASITPREMAAAAEAGDDAVREVLVRAAEYLGIGVANVVTILYPALVVLGGGVVEIGPLLFDTVRETVCRRVGMFSVDDVRIERSLLGDKAGVLGGIALAMKRGLIEGYSPRLQGCQKQGHRIRNSDLLHSTSPKRVLGFTRTKWNEEDRMDYTYEQIAKMIDHSLLSPTLTTKDLEQGCQIALEYDVASVCIMPYHLKRCAELLSGSTVKASTTIGFPHGGHTTVVKVAEAKQALDDGGEELDMVVNISKVLSGDWDYVRDDIKAVIEETHARGQKVKVIFENCYLDDEHRIRLCEICGELRADWVKTSTGYGTGGATMEDLKLMRKYSPSYVQVKAAGGVRSLDRLLEVRALGVTRVGASRTVTILDECRRRLG